ncbi:MAG TPA: hypothetical protein VEL07_19430 [Planctomycetota bacterium]|nr:hypothetical protein [Planctomycetota bacterium]
MSRAYPLSFSHRDDDRPSDGELSMQTLHGVRIEDAEAAALARWNAKRARRAALAEGRELTPIVGADGATRYLDRYGNVRATGSSRTDDRAQVIRINRALEPTSSHTGWWILGAALVIGAAFLAFAFSY